MAYCAESIEIGEHMGAEAAALRAILVRRSDATPGGADLGIAAAGLTGLVQRHVVGQDQRAGRGDLEALAHRHAFLLEAGDFLQQGIGCQHHAIGGNAKILGITTNHRHVRNRLTNTQGGNTLTKRVDDTEPIVTRHERRLLLDAGILGYTCLRFVRI